MTSRTKNDYYFLLVVFVIAAITMCLYLWQTNARASSVSFSSKKPSLTKDLFSKGKALYEKQCTSCHGQSGAGDGHAAYLLYPKPRDFTKGQFRLISTTEMEATDEDLFKTLTRGMPGSSMPSWEFLSEKDRWALVYYIRYLEEFGEERQAGNLTDEELQEGLSWDQTQNLITKHAQEKSMEISAQPALSAESLDRGKTLFAQACASCHGATGKGDGQMKMKDSAGYPLSPRDLTAGIFKGSSEANDLYYRIAGGLPGSPMPGYKDALTEEQIWDLIRYVQTLPDKEKEADVGLRQQQLVVQKVQGDLAMEPNDGQWAQIQPSSIPLTPLWWRNDRIESVKVRAVYNQKQIAIHLEWEDTAEDSSTVAPQSFSDGVALQFSSEASPPIFAMGSKNSPVTLWHWKASWEKEMTVWEDIETKYPHTATDFYEAQTDYEHGAPFETKDFKTKTHDVLYATGRGAGNTLSNPERTSAGEEARATGIGSLTPMKPSIEKVDVAGIYRNGKWQVAFVRDLKVTDSDRLKFGPKSPMNIAFAIWDGGKGDRNGQKMVSFWNEMTFES